MNIYGIFYADKKYEARAPQMKEMLRDFYHVYHYNREWLVKTDFYEQNKEILDMPRGGGYWLWKPFIILDAMDLIDQGDVVFYCDAGDDLLPGIYKALEKHMVNHDYYLSQWGNENLYVTNMEATKRDCFVLMKCSGPRFWNPRQIEAGNIAFKKTEFNLYFLNEWLTYCQDKMIITDTLSDKEFKEFKFHRHDQSILMNLSIKYNMKYSDAIKPFIKPNVFNG